jgi:YVTN family beta-propeller protein
MIRRRLIIGWWILLYALALGQAKKPVYVGARACANCHAGATTGHQYSKWMLMKHSMGYATLAKPESYEIAKISGIKEQPQKSPTCLGCHVTAFDAEAWEKDDGFRIEEGVQCETCHGAGSEYMDADVMRNHEASTKAGLKKVGEQYCLGCHIEKGSHVAVLKSPTVDIKNRFKDIAHPKPANFVPTSIPKMPEAQGPGPKYVGSDVCGSCHKGQEMGHQWSVWRMSPHSRAWADLTTPKAKEIAAKQGVTGDPQLSPKCLGCHLTGGGSATQRYAASFEVDEGVGCEACHGPGSDYMPEAIMRDKKSSLGSGLRKDPANACMHCHSTTHDKPFNPSEAFKKIAHPTRPEKAAPVALYKTPLNLTVRPGSREMYVTMEASNSVAVIDTTTRAKIAEISTGGAPTDVAFSPDGKRAFVSNREEDSVSVIDTAERKVIATLKTGDEPHGLLTDAKGTRLYVLNTSSDDISVFDVATLKWIKNLNAGRAPWSLALSPDGSRIAVTNTYSSMTGFRKPLRSEVTVIDTEKATVVDRWNVPDTNLMMGVAWHPSGAYALATLNRTKNLVPMTRLMQGWTITNGIAVLHKDGRVDEVLLDMPGLGFADATDVMITPDGKYALVTSSGTDRLAVVDCAKLIRRLSTATKTERENVIPNHLGEASGFVVKYIPVKNSPRGVTVAPDGSVAYVANAIDDSVSVIDLKKLQATGTIDLGGSKEITKQRFGERLFHSANICFRRQFSCHSCHPDGHIDQLAYDIESDGIGVSPVDNRTLRGILDTAPFKWEGTNATLSRQCGPRLSVFFTRIQPFNPEQLAAIDYYITTIPRPPNRYRAVGAPLTPAQRRGRDVFYRARTADGREVPEERRCVTCHMPPYYTSRKIFDVGTKQGLDRQGKFDVPHLNNIYDSAPYLHNGMAETLEEIWTVYNPYDKHGVTNDLTKDQLNDLIEYLKTL